MGAAGGLLLPTQLHHGQMNHRPKTELFFFFPQYILKIPGLGQPTRAGSMEDSPQVVLAARLLHSFYPSCRLRCSAGGTPQPVPPPCAPSHCCRARAGVRWAGTGVRCGAVPQGGALSPACGGH